MQTPSRTERLLYQLARLPLPLLQGLGAMLGWLLAWIPNRHQRVTFRNLDLCFPELNVRERRRLGRQSLVELGKTVTETVVIWFGNSIRLRRLAVRVSGEEAVRKAFTEGKGIIFAAPHLGSWEFLSLYLGTQFPMTALFRPPRQTSLSDLVRHARERMGANLVPTDASGVKALYQALNRGETLGIPPDQDPRDNGGVFAPFFGVPACTMTLVSRLVRKSNAAVFFAFAERLPRGKGFHVRFLPAPEGVADPDLQRSAAAINSGVETCVRLAPAQYQWSYKRFRTRPEGERALY